MLTLYNVISSDGFIARKNGGEDFIPDNLWQNFLDICREHGTLIVGRKTYDTIQAYSKELLGSFGKLPIKKIVVSGDRDFHPKKDYIVVHSPEEAFALEPDALVSSGPTLNNYLLKNGFVKNIILHEVPAAIGEGIRPFDFDKDGFVLVPINNPPGVDGVKVCEYKVQYPRIDYSEI
ncbi:MAG: hypothetical protein KGJ89_02645 [Patescibacteria group bacterium]|nr:hypothetical protein [Patescibacteria group bacterium]MDE2015777.1 hypothetical protein [Patescibacteria group bacterium]MDE2226834.1 hypothetical protein [Patescibacteria group bacterium]